MLTHCLQQALVFWKQSVLSIVPKIVYLKPTVGLNRVGGSRCLIVERSYTVSVLCFSLCRRVVGVLFGLHVANECRPSHPVCASQEAQLHPD